MQKFFFSLASGSQVATANKFMAQNVLINYQSKIASAFIRKPFHELVFVDCGGFSSSLIRGGYRSSDADYLSFVQRVRADFFALRDFPCEPSILQKWHRTVLEHIELTVDHHIQLLDHCADIESKPIPVIQGWKVTDYLYCIDRFRDQGLLCDYMGIGSICRRGSQKQIRKIVIAISEELGNAKLHGFGISLNALRFKDVWDALFSADSGAWDFVSRWNSFRCGLSKRDASELEFRRFVLRLSQLQSRHQRQKTIPECCPHGPPPPPWLDLRAASRWRFNMRITYLVSFAGSEVAVVFDDQSFCDDWHLMSAALTAISNALQKIYLKEALQDLKKLPHVTLLYAGN